MLRAALCVVGIALLALGARAAPVTADPRDAWIVSLRADAVVHDAARALARFGIEAGDSLSVADEWRGLRALAPRGLAVDRIAAALAAFGVDDIEPDVRVKVAMHHVRHVEGRAGTPTQSPAPTSSAPAPTCSESTQTNVENWGIDRLDQTQLPLNGNFTAPQCTFPAPGNVTYYVVDTGIQINHTQFATNRATWGTTIIKGAPSEDDNGHGTFVAGQIGGTTYGIDKSASMVAVKVLDENGEGTLSDIIQGIQYVIAQHNASAPGTRSIANLSLGALYSRTLNRAIDLATKAGVVVIVAAGNESFDACLTSPASAAGAIAVGATTITDTLANFTNTGRCVDILAPGENLTSSWTSPNSTNEYAIASGTSFSSPLIAGLAGLFAKTNPALSINTSSIRAMLQSNATKDVIDMGTQFIFFSETPNLLAHVAS